MKKRVLKHKNRCEVEQYIKLKKRYDTFLWHHHEIVEGMTALLATDVTFSEFNRKYKKLLKKCYKKVFRSAIKANNYDTRCALFTRS